MTDQQRPDDQQRPGEVSLDALLEDRSDDADTWDDSAAAEQGNRPEDEMVSAGDDPAEVRDLAGDDENLDAVTLDEASDQYRARLGVDLDGHAAGPEGDVDGQDPLAGGR